MDVGSTQLLTVNSKLPKIVSYCKVQPKQLHSPQLDLLRVDINCKFVDFICHKISSSSLKF